MQRDGYSVESAIAKGRPLPDWYLEAPDVTPGDDFYLDSFFRLHTCRPSTMDGMAPIPWDTIVNYALMYNLDGLLVNHFVDCIRAMDNGFMEFHKAPNKALDSVQKIGNKTRQR